MAATLAIEIATGIREIECPIATAINNPAAATGSTETLTNIATPNHSRIAFLAPARRRWPVESYSCLAGAIVGAEATALAIINLGVGKGKILKKNWV
jgi:hypothetical protein